MKLIVNYLYLYDYDLVIAIALVLVSISKDCKDKESIDYVVEVEQTIE